jgi:mono/diheme cytochrome c family protein
MECKMKKLLVISASCSILLVLSLIYFGPKSPVEAYSSSKLTAMNIYEQNCIMCHGAYGEGNGPTVRALPVKPPNFAVAAWQDAVTDTGIATVIVGGGTSIGRSDYMPAFEYLDNTPELNALVEHVRTFGR